MDKKKNEDSIKKLEVEFHDFQKEWKKFLANDFRHLTENVNKLTENVGKLVEQSTIHQESNEREFLTVRNCLTAIDNGIITLTKRGSVSI